MFSGMRAITYDEMESQPFCKEDVHVFRGFSRLRDPVVLTTERSIC
jgi:hypothetical protein